MSKLTAMSKDGETIGVHPSLVAAHESLGWIVGGEVVTVAADDDIAALRAAYEAKLGKKPFPGWKEDELRKRMAG